MIGLRLEILDIHDKVADCFEQSDPGAAEAIRQVARAYIETGLPMSEIFDFWREKAPTAAVREAVDRAQLYCRRIAEDLAARMQVDA